MTRLVLRVIFGGFVLWLGGILAGGQDWTLGAELALAVVGWLIYLELVYAAPVREGRRRLAIRDARALAAVETAKECRELSDRVMGDDFRFGLIHPGELKITLDTAAELLEAAAGREARL